MVVWAPMMTIMPHNHSMWAVIGIYTGREDNIFWRRLLGSPRRVEAAGAKALCERDAAPLGRDIIHSVTNPILRLTGAIHVYGGDFFDPTHRNEWTRKPCWKDRSIRNARFAVLKKQMQFLRADKDNKANNRLSGPGANGACKPRAGRLDGPSPRRS